MGTFRRRDRDASPVSMVSRGVSLSLMTNPFAGEFLAVGLELGERRVAGLAGHAVLAGEGGHGLKAAEGDRGQQDGGEGGAQDVLHGVAILSQGASSTTVTVVACRLTSTTAASSGGTPRKSATGLTSF